MGGRSLCFEVVQVEQKQGQVVFQPCAEYFHSLTDAVVYGLVRYVQFGGDFLVAQLLEAVHDEGLPV